jgi:transcriptional pleiotropic regulator of transition state genes
MKSTGVKRMIDNLGRIVLPIEIRNALDINARDYVEIYVEKDAIILKKHENSCVICGNKTATKEICGKKICDKCLGEIKEL